MKKEIKTFIGRDNLTLVEKLFVVKYIRRNKHVYKYVGFRENKNGHLFLITANDHKLWAITTTCESGHFNMENVGFANYNYNPNSEKLHLDRIRVFDKYKNQGVGQEMLDFIKCIAVSMKASAITLDKMARYYNGEEECLDTGFDFSNKKLEEMRKKEKPIIDLNSIFYKKNGFEVDENRNPIERNLVPMILKKPIVVKKPSMITLNEFYKMNLHIKSMNEDNIQTQDGCGKNIKNIFRKK